MGCATMMVQSIMFYEQDVPAEKMEKIRQMLGTPATKYKRAPQHEPVSIEML